MKRPKDTRHHRKPRSWGGGWEPENISLVPPDLHNAWHTLMGNKTPEQIIKVFNAWYLLFEGMTVEEVADEVNRIWLDPDYKMVVRRR